jgi:hypothetical protein
LVGKGDNGDSDMPRNSLSLLVFIWGLRYQQSTGKL